MRQIIVLDLDRRVVLVKRIAKITHVLAFCLYCVDYRLLIAITVTLATINLRIGVASRRAFVRYTLPSLRTMATTANGTSIGEALAAMTPKHQKLHGRPFYESIGSPKFVLAPMVDASEFVCATSHNTC